MSVVYKDATRVFKVLRDLGWVHKEISRRKATNAIVVVLNLRSSGNKGLPHTTYPYVAPLLDNEKTYNSSYINQAFGVLRYLRGDYLGDQ